MATWRPGVHVPHQRVDEALDLLQRFEEIAWHVLGAIEHQVLEQVRETGLARGLAWAADRWADRHLLAALLDDPEAVLR